MSTIPIPRDAAHNSPPLLVQLKPLVNLTDDQFFDFCQLNRNLRIERTSLGEMLIMSPTGFDSAFKESEIIRQLANWAKQDGSGVVASSSGGFRLPNGAIRSPDASWTSKARLAEIPVADRQKFLPLCPDFVVELLSPSDSLSDLQKKLAEYVEQGTRLGLLIVPESKCVYVYRPQQPVQELNACEVVKCDPMLPGFELVMAEIW